MEFILFFGDEEGERSAVFGFEVFGDFCGWDATGSGGDIELGDLEVLYVLCYFS